MYHDYISPQSNKDEAQRRLTDDLNENEEMITEKKKALRDLSPTVNALEKKLDDQSRHKKNLQNNIKVFQQVAKEKDLVAEKAKINEEIELIEGSDDSQAKYDAANKKIRDLEDKRNRAEGRRNGVKDQVKLLKRKLNTEDYKNVDERHRQIMIKTIATDECVNDLGKYYKALDNALLRYHGMKIADINKIIRKCPLVNWSSYSLPFLLADIYHLTILLCRNIFSTNFKVNSGLSPTRARTSPTFSLFRAPRVPPSLREATTTASL